MTTDLEPRLMPAGTTNETHPTPEKDRRGVNTVALFDLFREAKRFSDLSDVEKFKRLESARQLRQEHADKAARLNAFHGLGR